MGGLFGGESGVPKEYKPGMLMVEATLEFTVSENMATNLQV